MEKYRFRSTVYLVFLLVSLFVNVLLMYMLISDEISCDVGEPLLEEVDTSSLLKEAQSVYEGAYKTINGENNNFYIATEYKSLNDPENICYLVNFNGLEHYFTEKLITELMDGLEENSANYYDCNEILKSRMLTGLFGSSDQGIRELSYVTSNDDTLLVLGKLEYNSYISGDKYPFYMILKKVNEKWLIDSFE